MSADVSWCQLPWPWNNTCWSLKSYDLLQPLWNFRSKDSAVQAKTPSHSRVQECSRWLIRNVKELKNLDQHEAHEATDFMTKSWPSHSKACLNWWLYVGLRHRAPSRDIPPVGWGEGPEGYHSTRIDSPFLMDFSIGKIHENTNIIFSKSKSNPDIESLSGLSWGKLWWTNKSCGCSMVFLSFSDKPISKLPTPPWWKRASLKTVQGGSRTCAKHRKNNENWSLLFTPKASIRFLDVHPPKICGFQRFWLFLIPIYHPLMGGLKSYYILYIDTNTIANHCHELKHVLFVSVCSRRSPETVRSRSHDPTFSATWSLANTAWPGEQGGWKPPQKKAGPYRPYWIGKSMWYQWAHKLGGFKMFFWC